MTPPTTLTQKLEAVAEDFALDFSDAYEVPVEHPKDQHMRSLFQRVLVGRFKQAVVATQEEFADYAKSLARREVA